MNLRDRAWQLPLRLSTGATSWTQACASGAPTRRARSTCTLGFGAGLLGLYARIPGMRRPGSPFPNQDRMALAKDAWLAATGAALVVGDRSRR